MVAAVGHALPDSAFVWVDIFAVRQWPGNVADLNFRPVVRGTGALLLCATPLDSVAQLRVEDVTYGRAEVPDEARRECAFFRLWCIVELTAALLAAKPVVMLIGRAAVTSNNGGGSCLDFDAQPMMGAALIEMVNIEKAECGNVADRSRELALVKQDPGFAAVNKLARGAIGGAMFSMPHREVLQAACGFVGPLQRQLCGGSNADREEPWSLVQVVDALCSSVAGGFPAVFNLLMDSATHLAGTSQVITTTAPTECGDEGAPRMTHHPLDTCGSLGRTPMQCAAMYGRAEFARRLLARGASANLALRENGGTPLYMAAVNGHVDVAKELLAAGADPNLGLRNGATPLWIAAERDHMEMVKQLVEFGASLNTPHHGGTTPLIEAAHLGRLEVVKELADLGASLDLVAENGASALYMAALAGHHAVVKELAAREAAVNFQGVDTMRWALPNDEAAAAARALQDGQEGEEEAEQVGGVTVPAFCLGELTFSDSGSDEDDQAPTDSDEDDVGEDDESDKDVDAEIEHLMHLMGGVTQKQKYKIAKNVKLQKRQKTFGSNADDDSEEDHQDDGDDDDDDDNGDDDDNDDDDDSVAGDEHEEDGESHQATKNSILEMLEMSIRSDEQRRENLGKKKNRVVPKTTPADAERLTVARLAAEKGDAPAMRELVSLGMAVDMAGDDGRTLLHLAAAEGHTDVVGMLLGAGAGLDARDRWKQTPLHRAAWNGHQKVAEMLLAKGARVNVSDNDWSTPLHAATFTGHVEIAEALISHGASVEGLKEIRIMAGVDGHRRERITRLVRRMTRASMMTSPLFVAAAKGHLQTVKELVRAGAMMDVAGCRNGVTPLHAAALEGHVEVVCELLREMKKSGVEVANVADKNGRTPLRFAARGGNVEVMRELLAHASGAVEVGGRDGARPLHVAAQAGHAKVVGELVKAGAAIEATEMEHGQTALLLAAQSGRAEVVRELVQAGADVTCLGEQNGLTPLECAVRGGHAEVVRELLAHPMVVDEVARTKSGLTHAHIAARGGHAAVLQELAQAGVDVDAPSAPELLTPAHIAAKSGHLEVALTLVAAGASLEQTNSDGHTVLALALASGHDALSAALLEAGAEVDAVLTSHPSIIHVAAAKGLLATAKKLLAMCPPPSTVDLGAEDAEGCTPLMVAISRGHDGVADALLEAGADVNAGTGQRPIHATAVRGSLAMLQKLMANGADLSAADSEGHTALQYLLQPELSSGYTFVGGPSAGHGKTPITSPVIKGNRRSAHVFMMSKPVSRWALRVLETDGGISLGVARQGVSPGRDLKEEEDRERHPGLYFWSFQELYHHGAAHAGGKQLETVELESFMQVEVKKGDTVQFQLRGTALAVALNDGPFETAFTELPSDVVPFVLLADDDNAVKLVASHREPACMQDENGKRILLSLQQAALLGSSKNAQGEVMLNAEAEGAAGGAGSCAEAALRATTHDAHAAACAAPCGNAHCGSRFAETWDEGATFHCFSCKRAIAQQRWAAERAAMEAVKQADAARAPPGAEREAQQVGRGVRVGWLKAFAARAVCKGLATWEVVGRVVKPGTEGYHRCRYVELPEMAGAVGRATVFVSHTWGARLADTVAAIAHVLDDDAFVWLDIFAVRQWPGNEADLDFQSLVRDTDALLLCAVHLDSVARLNLNHVDTRHVPDDALKMCAFFRVWCLVELVAALHNHKPVVLLIGTAQEEGGGAFLPNTSMCSNLYYMLDVRNASASVEADRVRILGEVERNGGGYAAVNTLARGAINGASLGMQVREVLMAACGNPGPLEALCSLQPVGERHVQALRAAAAFGFLRPLGRLIATGVGIESVENAERNRTALMGAADSGHARAVRMLIEAGANPESQDNYGWTSAHFAANGGHLEALRVLQDAGADLSHAANDGRTPVHLAATERQVEVLRMLQDAGVDLSHAANDGRTPTHWAAFGGDVEALRVMQDAGADLSHADNDGCTPAHEAAAFGHEELR
ncbi:hypothetical protein CYMTET_45246 [Cymbomonas tetramitiformis]|uniref:Uncharacterized protein n=1 Tax=Cymbomonas tetramitiformis TaxID=36881 RepID=A0AAE0EYS3_9CHLO|nr:hypothetical protein CYMTET_45246 [Cymbomonas tetramitiformis]